MGERFCADIVPAGAELRVSRDWTLLRPIVMARLFLAPMLPSRRHGGCKDGLGVEVMHC